MPDEKKRDSHEILKDMDEHHVEQPGEVSAPAKDKSDKADPDKK